MKKMIRAAVAPVLLLVAAGCNDLIGGDLGGPQRQREQLDQARAVWSANRPANYAYRLDVACTCFATPAADSVFVEVRGNTATMNSYEDPDWTPPAAYQSFGTVERLFALIEERIQIPTRQVRWRRIMYDGDVGNPVDVDILLTSGEQVVFRVSELREIVP